MARFIIALLLIAFSFTAIVHAKKITIPMTHHTSISHQGPIKENPWKKNKRSITDNPIVTYDNGTLHIYTYTYMENAIITISDKNGNYLYSIQTNLMTEEQNQFTIDYIKSGNYFIELETSDDYYYGYFEITQ